jgi:hypothetical protein
VELTATPDTSRKLEVFGGVYDHRMRRTLILAVAAAMVAAVACGAAPAARGGVPSGTFSGCPRDTRPLPPRPLVSYAPAVRGAALQFVRTSFLHLSVTAPAKLVGARITQILLVRDWLPSGWIKTECGLKVWQRSVAVNVYFPRLDPPHNPVGHCNSCAHLVFLAARTQGGWTVWGDY